MLALTKKMEYALIAISYLAERSSRMVSAREIAAAFEMPVALVMNILKTLHHCGLLKSTRGMKGGYRLCEELGKISMHRLIELIEGPVRLTECSPAECESHDPVACKVRHCPISKPIQTLHVRLIGYLKGVRLSDLIPAMRPADGEAECVRAAMSVSPSAGGGAAP